MGLGVEEISGQREVSARSASQIPFSTTPWNKSWVLLRKAEPREHGTERAGCSEDGTLFASWGCPGQGLSQWARGSQSLCNSGTRQLAQAHPDVGIPFRKACRLLTQGGRRALQQAWQKREFQGRWVVVPGRHREVSGRGEVTVLAGKVQTSY